MKIRPWQETNTCRSLSTDDARARLVDIYTQSIHCQPLPLFDPQRFSENARSGKLSADLETGLGYLDYTSPIEAFAVQQLRRSAYESLAEGDVSLDLAQLFCVLILVSMKCKLPMRALLVCIMLIV